ncbi:MAG: CotH kinase family protein [Flavobacteriales bacterium]|nr:CotH kinase family protein [Flavobacteriales bacterium]MCB9193608.1 CotH kinase family protein [Flavobacteriales bacterium]
MHKLIPLSGLVLAAASIAAGGALRQTRIRAVLRDARFGTVQLGVKDDRFLLEAGESAQVRYTLDGTLPGPWSPRWAGPLPFRPDIRTTSHLQHLPTSIQWRSPIGQLPTAMVVRACICTEVGCGKVATRTIVPRSGGLPMVALTLEPGAFFDPDTGIYVPGNGPFHTKQEAVRHYPANTRWWKYPGNYQFRGRGCERTAWMETFTPDGREQWGGSVRVRINGNNTRGFPQHALRLLFDTPVDPPIFAGAEGQGFRALVLRTAGNDMDRCFGRDALQHRLCAGLGFSVSADESCVVFINGAYWGIHHLRERVDDDEIGRRFGLDPKQITILADDGELYRGDEKGRRVFIRFISDCNGWDATSAAFADSLDAHIDLDGAMVYLAAQIILGNTDWPDQNVKYWRWEGRQKAGLVVTDGRWRFIMGDSDLGFGYNGGPDYDMFVHMERHFGPVACIYRALMRSPELRLRFRKVVLDLIDGPLSSEHMVAAVDAIQRELASEMPQHIARWRRPLDMDTWYENVTRMRTFAARRGSAIRAQLERHLSSENDNVGLHP